MGKNFVVNTAIVSTKGQLVIPRRFRQALKLEAGDKVSFSLEGDTLLLQRHQPNRARLKKGRFGRPVLVAPSGALPMTPERVKELLDEVG